MTKTRDPRPLPQDGEAPAELPPPEPAAGRPREVHDYLHEMQEQLLVAERVLAGHTVLMSALNTATGQLGDGERPRGLPIFKFKGSVDGVNTVDCVVDLKHVDKNYVAHVLVPLINAQGAQLLEAARRLKDAAAAFESHVAASVPPPAAEGEAP